MRNPVVSYDLHLHSYWSHDAVISPEAYLRQAGELGMRCIALTEHYSIDSFEELSEAARRFPSIRIVPAAELTVSTSVETLYQTNRSRVDLLCYGFAATHTPGMQRVFDRYQQWLCESREAFFAGMRSLGFDYTEEHRLGLLRSYRPGHVVDRQGNNVLAQYDRELAYFIERGFAASEKEAREVYKRAGEAAAAPSFPPVEEVAAAVKGEGGLVAIAHPFRYFRDDRAKMDAMREECLLDGIECAHPTVPREITPLYRDYCAEHGLFSVAGSDSHLMNDRGEPVSPHGFREGEARGEFGRHGGAKEWLDEFLERLDGR